MGVILLEVWLCFFWCVCLFFLFGLMGNKIRGWEGGGGGKVNLMWGGVWYWWGIVGGLFLFVCIFCGVGWGYYEVGVGL